MALQYLLAVIFYYIFTEYINGRKRHRRQLDNFCQLRDDSGRSLDGTTIIMYRVYGGREVKFPRSYPLDPWLRAWNGKSARVVYGRERVTSEHFSLQTARISGNGPKKKRKRKYDKCKSCVL